MSIICFDPTFGWKELIQLGGFVGAIWGITYQLNKQREMQKEKSINELQISIYENLTNNIDSGSPVGVATTMRIIVGSLYKAKKEAEGNNKYVPPPFQPNDVNNEFLKICTNLWKTVSAIERYEIISPNMALFRKVLVKKIIELSNVYVPLIQIFPYILLSDKGISEPEKLVVLDDKNIMQLEENVDTFYEVAFDVAAYLQDIKVESQNILLGKLFPNKVPVRVPEDTASLVLTSGDINMITKIKEYLKESN